MDRAARLDRHRTQTRGRRFRTCRLACAIITPRSLLSPEGEALKARTAELMANGLRGFDALHVACAEAAGVDLFVTCDDRQLAAAQRLGSKIKVRVGEITAVAREVLS